MFDNPSVKALAGLKGLTSNFPFDMIGVAVILESTAKRDDRAA